jgi:hypothetical protein
MSEPKYTNFLRASCPSLLGGALMLLTLSCSTPPEVSSSPAVTVVSDSRRLEPLWSDRFANPEWRSSWNIQNSGAWGEENMQVINDPNRRFAKVLRLRYPKNSASPSVARKNKVPIGGGQFYANLGIAPRDTMQLSYYVRFSDNFDFVKGGKLPGLFGGDGNSGGTIPNGKDGFSTRFMWRRNGDGELYAYLPTSDKHGTSIGRGNWRFRPGVWHHLEQEVTLNQPGKANGRVKVWVDSQLVLDQDRLTFRTTDDLKINGIFFSTFFGGGNSSWATPKDVHVDFAEFQVSKAGD